jgi:DNA-binding response OmpR family regulator
MNRNVLIIEDNDQIRECTAELLILEGFHVSTADCGSNAMIQIKGNLLGLIIAILLCLA